MVYLKTSYVTLVSGIAVEKMCACRLSKCQKTIFYFKRKSFFTSRFHFREITQDLRQKMILIVFEFHDWLAGYRRNIFYYKNVTLNWLFLLKEKGLPTSVIVLVPKMSSNATIRYSKNGLFPASFFFIFVFSIQLTVINVQYKFCGWLDSNRIPLVSEATALPTEPQPLPTKTYVMASNGLQQKIYFWGKRRK